ncbi:uncharacterized protein N7496_012401 [Penicillium cataractarum]|uniref:Uncharacterized protein n=1 Tax=Penicillium cataractarum TaxID=2100454 RepID=A0A9W9RAE8_9EURO|nr:uncharacterized protein N7496_012401 [Penicillium cataractarum]KAJ5355189.1 hypothetical protein N7496_012401 [Penicillium cataractarum]
MDEWNGGNQIKPNGGSKGGQRCAMVGGRTGWRGRATNEKRQRRKAKRGRAGRGILYWLKSQFLAGPAGRPTTYQNRSSGETELDTVGQADFLEITPLDEPLPKLTHVYITFVTVIPSQHEFRRCPTRRLIGQSELKVDSGGGQFRGFWLARADESHHVPSSITRTIRYRYRNPGHPEALVMCNPNSRGGEHGDLEYFGDKVYLTAITKYTWTRKLYL